MARKYEGKKFTPTIARGLVIGAVFVAVGVGLAFGAGTGTLSSFGIGAIASICPLGALESLFGTWAFVPRAIISFAAVCALVFVVGDAFCAWVCPVPPLRRFFMGRKAKELEQNEQRQAADLALSRYRAHARVKRPAVRFDSRHGVLLGALAATAVFGFPVFCLVCPVGLTFATFIAVWQLFQFSEPSWGLLVFPAIVVVELVLMRKWCRKICPIGALFSLVSCKTKTFEPHVDRNKCLRITKAEACNQCSRACPELADPHSDLGIRPLSECTRCNKCAEACPVAAISFPFLAKETGNIDSGSAEDRVPVK